MYQYVYASYVCMVCVCMVTKDYSEEEEEEEEEEYIDDSSTEDENDWDEERKAWLRCLVRLGLQPDKQHVIKKVIRDYLDLPALVENMRKRGVVEPVIKALLNDRGM